MNLKEQIEKDFIQAMKSKDPSLDVLRMVKTSIKNKEIEKQSDLKDEDIISVLQKEKKQREESVKEFEKGNRSELAEKEKNEIKIIEKYLPTEMSDNELEKIVENAISEVKPQGIQDMGKIMSVVMPKVQGKADGSRVSDIVKQKLSK